MSEWDFCNQRPVPSLLNVLPHEILCEVFSHLSPFDARQMTLVSTQFERLSNHASVWKKFCLRELDIDEEELHLEGSIDWKTYYREKQAFTSSFSVHLEA